MNTAGFGWATLRGIVAVVGMTACASSPTGPTPVAASGELGALIGDWSLTSVEEGEAATSLVPAGAFALGFGPDGDLFIQADCNVCSAAYAAEADGGLEVRGPIPCTLAHCPTAPLDTRFVGLVEASSRWAIRGSTLELSSARATLVLERTGP